MEPLADQVGWLFGWLLRNSAQAALLGALLFLLELTLLRRLTPRWRYGLWLIVIVRLLVPAGPESALSLANLVDFAPSTLARLAHEVLGLHLSFGDPSPDPAGPLADTPAWFVVAFACWLPGAVFFAGLIWRDHRRIRRALSGTIPITTGPASDLLRQCRGVMRVRWPVQIVETPRIGSPAIAGWLRPRVLLPKGLLQRLSADETRFLLLHELAHVKRADIALNWLLAAVQILHWFNPLVWIALRRLLAVREEVCDEMVLRRSFRGASREYGLTLLRLLEECAPRRIVPALAGVLDDIRSLRQRMRCIRDFGLEEKRPWLPAVVTVSIAVIGLTERPFPNAEIPPHPASVRAELRPGRNSVAAPRLRDQAGIRVVPAEEESGRRRSASVKMMTALSTVMYEAATPNRGPAANLGDEARAEGESTGAETAAHLTLASGRAGVSPVRLDRRNGAATPTSRPAPAITRLYPLPPIGQRGDILRPPKERP